MRYYTPYSPAGFRKVAAQTQGVHEQRARGGQSKPPPFRLGKVTSRRRIVARDERPNAKHVRYLTGSIVIRARDLLLNVIAAQFPQRQSAKRCSGQQRVQFL